MTHHNAHILTLAVDPEVDGQFLTVYSTNGETSPAVSCPDLAKLSDAIHSIFRTSLADDAPLLVVVAKGRLRSTAAEVELTRFANTCVRDAMATVPETQVITVAGVPLDITTEAFAPRVTVQPLGWGTSALRVALYTFTHTLAHGDDVLGLLPDKRTSPAEAFSV